MSKPETITNTIPFSSLHNDRMKHAQRSSPVKSNPCQLYLTPGPRAEMHTAIWGFPKIRGTLFGGLHNKAFSILGSILGSPYFGKLPYEVGSLL